MKIKAFFQRIFNKLKQEFLADKIGFVFEYLAYASIFFSVISLPLFTYRDEYTFITNSLCISTSVFIAIYIFLRGKFYINHAVMSLVLLLLYGTVLTLFTTKSQGYERLFSMILLFVFVIFIIEFFFNKFKYKFFIVTTCLSMTIFLIFFVLAYRENIIHMNFDQRFGYDFGNVNVICFMFDIGVMFLLYISFLKKRWYFFLLIPAFLMFFCAFITGSRWGLVSLIAGVLFLLYEFFGRKYKIEYFIGLFIIIGVAIALLQLPQFAEYKKHFTELFSFLSNKNKRGSSAVRTAMFIDGIKLWLKNIVFGYGCDGFKANTSYGMFSHSSIIEMLTNFGIIGFFLFFVPIIRTFMSAKTKKNYLLPCLTRSMCLLFLFYSFFANLHVSKLGMICVGFFLSSNFRDANYKQYYFSISFFENKHFAFKFRFNKPIKKEDLPTNPVPEKLKIAFVISTLKGGGAERVSTILANNWIRKHEVVFFLTSRETQGRYLLDSNIRVVNIATKKKISLIPSYKIFKLSKELNIFKPDVVVSFLKTPSYYASCAVQNTGIPFVTSERCDPAQKTNVIYKLLTSITFDRADHIVFQGDNARNHFPALIQRKSSIIMNPCSVDRIAGLKKTKTIIAAGRLEKQKGFDVLIQSFSKISDRFPNYCVNIYGTGSQKEKLDSIIKDANMNDKIQILPFSDSLLEKIQSSSLYVLSSRYEGMPNVLCEALLLGTPCVSTDCPIGVSKTLLDGMNNGIICKTDDIVDLSFAIAKVLDNLESYEKEALKNIDYYKNLFNPEKIANEWIDIFGQVIARS